MKQGVTQAARLLEQQAAWESRRSGRPAYVKKFITLTFRDGDDWQPRCISDFLECVRKWMKRRGYTQALKYVHVAELQKRGAIHYHVVLWLPRKLRLPCPDHCGWWPWGMSQVQTARNPVGYLVKYATKTKPEGVGGFPKGARIYGRGGLTPSQAVELRETLAPWWIRKHYKERQQAADQEYFDRLELERLERCMWDELEVAEFLGEPPDPDVLAFAQSRGWFDPPSVQEECDLQDQIDEYERRAEEERLAVAYAREYGPKGCPRFKRVSGGFVNLWDGEFIETPYIVEAKDGVVTIYPKYRTVQ